MTALYLADKSALARLGQLQVQQRLGPLLERGLVATCAIVELEMLFSARSPSDYEEIRGLRRAAYTWIPVTEVEHERALDVQRQLAARGMHRAVTIPDLLIGAVAESAGLTVLHYDQDFDHIALVTGQPCEWVVPAGSVP